MSAYGVVQQGKANKAALAQNQSATDSANATQWSNYLMTRGIAPTGAVTPGQLPGPGQSRVVNARLPLWATVPAVQKAA